MAKILYAPTEPFIRIEMGKLDADASAGSNVSLTLESNNQIAVNDYIVIGYEGSELAELEQVNQITGNTGARVTTLKFNHKKGEPIVKYLYNKRKFYGATSENGSYTQLTGDGSPKDIQVDDSQGTILEYTGSTYTYFKSTYYNSQTSTETDIADALAVLGDESLRYATIYGIRKHAGLMNNPFYSDGRIETKRKQAESEINSLIYSKYSLPLTEVPALLGQICELLAAGYIDFEEFGKDGEGVKWLGTGRALLNSIMDGKHKLIGADGEELATKELANTVQSYPDTVDNTNGPTQRFTMNQVF